ncbi:hypothetical protein [Hallella bergensis]|nr:hypothetical protein [Hallella bergensis]
MKKTSSLKYSFAILVSLILTMTLGSCYEHQRHSTIPFEFSEHQIDSLSFFSTHHYTNNYNFVVKSDSLELLRQLPEELISGMQTDSFAVYQGAHLVVADIRMIPTDSIDSVWVQLANDTSAFGWTRENKLLESVMPDDPISEFISDFSNSHVLIFLVIIVVIAASYLLWNMFRRNARIVHFNDINSFYPTALCLIVGTSATLYAAIQTFFPQMWQHFYYHPTLNPFSVPFVLGVFLSSVWVMLIMALAVIDDVRHQLPFGEAVIYLGGLAAVCAVNYIVFSITTLYYVGYILLVIYYYYAIRQYYKHNRAHYVCGNCGAKLQHKGTCKYCGSVNE